MTDISKLTLDHYFLFQSFPLPILQIIRVVVLH